MQSFHVLSTPCRQRFVTYLRIWHPAHSSTGAQQTAVMMAFAGQNISQIDSLFVGDILGKKSDIADGSLRDWDFRKFNNLVGDYWVAPSFLDNMGVRIPKPLQHSSWIIVTAHARQVNAAGV